MLHYTSNNGLVLMVKNPPANAGHTRDTGSIPGSGRSPGGGRGNPLQCSCLENPMDRGDGRATVHGVTKGQTRLEWLSTHPCTQIILHNLYYVQFSSVTQSCKTVCDPMDCTTPGFPVHLSSQSLLKLMSIESMRSLKVFLFKEDIKMHTVLECLYTCTIYSFLK